MSDEILEIKRALESPLQRRVFAEVMTSGIILSPALVKRSYNTPYRDLFDELRRRGILEVWDETDSVATDKK
jgi:phage-related protein